jgi:NADH-quinone oxidoreductase subunit N
VESNKSVPLSNRLAIWISAGGVLLAAALLTGVPASAGDLLVTDPLARVFKMVVLGLGLLAILLPPAKREIAQPGEYQALLLFALTGLLLATGTNHLLFLFVALELAGLSLYLLAGFPRTRRAAEASLKYFLFGGVSAAFLLFGLSLIYGFSHSADLIRIGAMVAATPDSPLAMTGLAMVLAGLGFKLASAPFHAWAPDVYQGAPATTVALVSAASKVVGLVVLVRLLMIGFPAAAGSAEWGMIGGGWSMWLAVLAAVSMILGNVLALAQKSVRRLLAYSAVANSGYLLAGISSGGIPAAGAALFYVVVYGLATLGAVAVTAAVERDRGSDARESFAGLVHRAPLLAVALLVFMGSLAGIPPLAGFVGKFALFSHAMAATSRAGNPGLTWLIGLAAVMSAVSLFYYLSILKQAFVRSVEDVQPLRLPAAHVLAVVLPAAALVLLGLFPALLLDPILVAVAETLRGIR